MRNQRIVYPVRGEWKNGCRSAGRVVINQAACSSSSHKAGSATKTRRGRIGIGRNAPCRRTSSRRLMTGGTRRENGE